jgi:hypothetical protein
VKIAAVSRSDLAVYIDIRAVVTEAAPETGSITLNLRTTPDDQTNGRTDRLWQCPLFGVDRKTFAQTEFV